jgi:hypothetical protein
MNEPVVLNVAGRDVVIDPSKLEFNETNLTEYMEQEGALYNYYGQAMAEAQAQWQILKLKHEVLYSEKFRDCKQGMSVAVAEAHVKSDPEVITLAKKVIAAARIVEILKNHLRAWDKNHDNAQSVGHMLRKEMDKLGFDIKRRQEQEYDVEKEIFKTLGD